MSYDYSASQASRYDNFTSYIPKYPNVSFYEGTIPALPNYEYIHDILKDWPRNFDILENNHNYIPWLFPNREAGLNQHAFTILPEEAKIFCHSPHLREKLKRAFKMMLEFYGMQLTKDDKFELAENAKERLRILNTKYNHNFNRITRILKCLLEFGHHNLMLPWLKFLAKLIYVDKTLNEAEDSFNKFWLPSLDAQDGIELKQFVNDLSKSKPSADTKHSLTVISNSAIDVQEGNTGHQRTSKILDFYRNKKALPNRDLFIDDILRKPDYDMLRTDPVYMYWLFPNTIMGTLQNDIFYSAEDAEEIRETNELTKKVLKAFEMMLRFYGMELTKDLKFHLYYPDKFYPFMLKDSPDRLKVTRILRALKELGHKELMLPWLKFLASLIYEYEYIPQACFSMENFWMETLDKKEKKELSYYINVRKQKKK